MFKILINYYYHCVYGINCKKEHIYYIIFILRGHSPE